MKIQIIGFSGSGKSTLAQLLSKYYNIPCLHLDNVHFYGDWQIRTVEEENLIVNKFLENNSEWVIDGNYSKISPSRFFESDITIYLNYNRLYCYKMCKKRYIENKNKSRESNPCIEKFDKEFKKWLLYKGRTIKRKKIILSNYNKTKGKKLMFKNKKQLEKWLISQHIIEGEYNV